MVWKCGFVNYGYVYVFFWGIFHRVHNTSNAVQQIFFFALVVVLYPRHVNRHDPYSPFPRINRRDITLITCIGLLVRLQLIN